MGGEEAGQQTGNHPAGVKFPVFPPAPLLPVCFKEAESADAVEVEEESRLASCERRDSDWSEDEEGEEKPAVFEEIDPEEVREIFYWSTFAVRAGERGPPVLSEWRRERGQAEEELAKPCGHAQELPVDQERERHQRPAGVRENRPVLRSWSLSRGPAAFLNREDAAGPAEATATTR